MIEKILERARTKASEYIHKSNEEASKNGNTLDFERFCGKKEAYEDMLIFVQEVAKEYGNWWIPFTQREMTEDEKECCGTEEGYMLDCTLPEEDEEILVTYANGYVDMDIFMRDGNECYLDSGNELVTEAVAWMRKPAPYQNGE